MVHDITAYIRDRYDFVSYLQPPNDDNPRAAVVMKMCRKADGRLHAIKLLRSKDFRTIEVDAAQHVGRTSSAVVPVTIMARNDHVTCLQMPFSARGDLFNHVVGGGCGFTVARVVDIVVQVLHSVCVMHETHTAHMDIKLENLLVDNDYNNILSPGSALEAETQGPTAGDIAAAQVLSAASSSSDDDSDFDDYDSFDDDDDYNAVGTVVKLTDFGSALCVGPQGKLMSAMVGTSGYMAPEIALADYRPGRRRPRVTTKCDIWSIGHLMYLMLTGKAMCAYSTACDATTCDRQLRVLERGTALREIEDPELRDIVAECMEIEPSQRPTARHLMHKVQRIRDVMVQG